MADLIRTNVGLSDHKVTAGEIESDCPQKLKDLGELIAVHFEKARRYVDKAEQQYTSIRQHLAEAQKICDEEGYKAFHKKFCPDLAKSRTYELLQIAAKKKSIAEVRANTRERVARHRAKQTTDSVTVTENPDAPPVAPNGPTASIFDSATVTEKTFLEEHSRDAAAEPLETPKCSSSVNPGDQALFAFSASVMELIRRTKGAKAKRFAATSVPADDLTKLGNYLSQVANLKRVRDEASEKTGPAVSARVDAAEDKLAPVGPAVDVGD